jgi:hypothetical protein
MRHEVERRSDDKQRKGKMDQHYMLRMLCRKRGFEVEGIHHLIAPTA